ncbi:hypothetical protein F0A17_11600 [Billgrantia pellis]|uniref:Uncharacterized protein n=1 Tax=Billgrantia pellis TaxID=2606936 RepID=A0A7V7KGB9_9GAMM|nr:hypothetical protein [Halomonas pellis]KAA0011938.1 hypothetical protein F0A17_11600 [Halomonas pellis]
MRVYRPEWHCTFTVNEGAGREASWRDRFAWRLRRFADRLDGKGRTVSIECHVEPEVSRQDIDTCLVKGFEVTHTLLNQLAQQAACEDVMRDAKSELFEQDPYR